PRRSHRPFLPLILQVRDDFGDDVAHELMLGGDALIDLSQRGRHNALGRLRRFALGSHASPSILGLLRRDPEFSVETIPALGHCHLAQLIARRGGTGSGDSLTSSARSRAIRNALLGRTPSTRARRSLNWVLTRSHSSVCKRLFTVTT